ncbi:hypothetical protein WN944_009374 [Citrus x changshan-huyou]|uniref:Uncharacterized protein n=1 Tax=Citrus x changshan-huyou TaxID=2935761 RepID=A0AAP0MPQ1_9ROSI
MIRFLGERTQLLLSASLIGDPIVFFQLWRVGGEGKDTAHELESESMKISCNTESTKAGFNNAASFEIEKGLREYHPISFVAKGAKRNFFWCH